MTLKVDLSFDTLKSRASEVRGEQEFVDESRLEQVYLGVTLIHKYHPSVRRVHSEILHRLFWEFDPKDCPARAIRKQVEGMRNIRLGEITQVNWFHGDPKWAWEPLDGVEKVSLTFLDS